MDTANAISGVQSLNSGLLRRPTVSTGGADVGSPGVETPPSGQPQTVALNQPVSASNEKSGLNGNGKNPDKQQVADAVKSMNDFLQMVRRTLQFTVDEDSGKMVIQVKDATTNEVIRQIPPENMLKLAAQMDKLKGLLFEEKA